MTKHLTRFLASMVLLAVLCTVAGTVPASAGGRSRPVTTSAASRLRQRAKPFSGEPDVVGQTAPLPQTPKLTPTTNVSPTDDDIVVWLIWVAALGQVIH